jgi:hypothetical protein
VCKIKHSEGICHPGLLCSKYTTHALQTGLLEGTGVTLQTVLRIAKLKSQMRQAGLLEGTGVTLQTGLRIAKLKSQMTQAGLLEGTRVTLLRPALGLLYLPNNSVFVTQLSCLVSTHTFHA